MYLVVAKIKFYKIRSTCEKQGLPHYILKPVYLLLVISVTLGNPILNSFCNKIKNSTEIKYHKVNKK